MSADSLQKKGRNMPKQLSTEDEAVSEITKQADARLAARRAARADAKRQEETISLKTTAALPDDVEALKAELQSLREKYQQAMMINVQQDNCKQTLRYQVDNLKEQFDDLETAQKNTRVAHQRLLKDAEQEKRILKNLEAETVALRQNLEVRNKLIQEYGLKINEEGEKDSVKVPSISVATAQTLMQLPASGEERYAAIADENEKLEIEIRRLQRQLADEKDQMHFTEKLGDDHMLRTTMSTELADKEVNLQITETRLKLKKAEQDLMALEGNSARLESQAKRYQSAAESAEKSEQELTAERDRLKKDLGEAVKELGELKSQNEQIQKSLDNWKLSKQNSIQKST